MAWTPIPTDWSRETGTVAVRRGSAEVSSPLYQITVRPLGSATKPVALPSASVATRRGFRPGEEEPAKKSFAARTAELAARSVRAVESSAVASAADRLAAVAAGVAPIAKEPVLVPSPAVRLRVLLVPSRRPTVTWRLSPAASPVPTVTLAEAGVPPESATAAPGGFALWAPTTALPVKDLPASAAVRFWALVAASAPIAKVSSPTAPAVRAVRSTKPWLPSALRTVTRTMSPSRGWLVKDRVAVEGWAAVRATERPPGFELTTRPRVKPKFSRTPALALSDRLTAAPAAERSSRPVFVVPAPRSADWRSAITALTPSRPDSESPSRMRLSVSTGAGR